MSAEGGRHSKSVAIAIGIALLFVGGAVASFTQAQKLRADAEWLMARSNAEATEYANTFEPAHADKQFKTFEERRVVLEKAGLYQRLQLFCILGAVLSAFSSYVLYLYWRLRQQLVEGTDGVDGPQLAVVPVRSP